MKLSCKKELAYLHTCLAEAMLNAQCYFISIGIHVRTDISTRGFCGMLMRRLWWFFSGCHVSETVAILDYGEMFIQV